MFKDKSFGQHFLTRPEVSKKIVEAAKISNADNVIEIGPGAGILTQYIIAANPKKLVLVELDERLLDALGKKFVGIDVINKDAAKISYETVSNDYFNAEDFFVLGNLPYNASTAILEVLCFSKKKPKVMVLMFQKEVAQRILAVPGSKIYSRLSLLASEFYNIKQVMQLPPGAFTPPPKVDSTVLYFSLRDKPLVDVKDRKEYDKVVHTAFSNKRKMIRNNLKQIIPNEILNDILSECGILPEQRPEEISIQKYVALSNLLVASKKI